MTVLAQHEVEINGLKYKILGDIKGAWLDPFPEIISTGEADYSNRRDLSSWIINSPLYIGVEEMEEKVDANKCWWTNCITKYRNHILPPRLATEIATLPATVSPPSITNANCEATTGWTNGSRSTVTTPHGGTYSWQVGTTETYQDLTWSATYQSKAFVFDMWVRNDTGGSNTLKIGINDGVGTTYSATTTADTWTHLYVIRLIDSAATRIRLLLNTDANFGYFDDATLQGQTIGTTFRKANFNGNLYMAFGNVLSKMNAGRTAFTPVGCLPATITAITPSLNSSLYIYLGDSDNYWYMSTAEAFIQSNSANANWGFKYDAKLFKVNTSGTVAYSTNPNAASPTWTSGGAINDIADQIEGFVVGRDAAGVYTPYAATNSIIKAYDSATPQWVDTEVKLPNHPIGGKGNAYWNGKLYFSYGLAVKEYFPETGAVREIGLTERDGLPVEYNGEITKLYGDAGSLGMFAAVDASVPSGNSKSGLYLYDGFGWQCWWIDTSNDGAMTDIIVSSAQSAYAVYWDVGGKIYYIDIPRGIENPDKISQSYATSGILITPWFDAGNPVASKLAKVLADYAKGVTTTETVALKYRLDHTNTDLDTGWTTMDTLNTTGESGYNEELFASGAGVSFKAIQFRLDFVTGGSTAKADIQSLVLYHKKRTGSEKLRTWAVTVICDALYNTTAKQKVANLKAVIESATDVTFLYHPNAASDESYYVTVNCPGFSEQSGDDYSANYDLTLIES